MPKKKVSIISLFILILVFPVVLAITQRKTIYRQEASGITPTPTPNASVDFTSRQNTSYPIPNNFLGLSGSLNTDVISQMGSQAATAGIRQSRIKFWLADVFPSAASLSDPSLQNWSLLDTHLELAKKFGFRPIIPISFSPSWMQPQNQNPSGKNYCITDVHTDPVHTFPSYIVNGVDTGPQTWGQIAKAVVAHVDKNFPGINPAYEIWNEPDINVFLCVSNSDPNPEQTELNEYKQIVSNAVPLMKAQAVSDGEIMRVGIPDLGSINHASLWIPSLFNDVTIAPYIDFIDYHDYVTFKPNDTWDQTATPIYFLTQDPAEGVAAQLEYLYSLLRKTSYPNAVNIPIYITEYNTFTNGPDCCKNDPIYGPLWTSVFMRDILHSVFDSSSQYGAAFHIPSVISYYAWNSADNPPPQTDYCMFGTLNMDCAYAGNIQPYPQYYAYLLFGGIDYLDMTNKGYIVNSSTVYPKSVLSASFFTATKDSIVLVNAGANDYQNFSLQVTNPGNVNIASISSYLLNQSNPHITAQSVTATSLGNNTYSLSVFLPKYSTLAISLPVSNVSQQQQVNYHVIGKSILDNNNNPFVPYGVELGGVSLAVINWRTNNSVQIGSDMIAAARNSWNANTIDLQLAPAALFAKQPYDQDYLDRIDRIVDAAVNDNMNTMLTLQYASTTKAKMPTQDSIAFWNLLSQHYASNPHVFFDLDAKVDPGNLLGISDNATAWTFWQNGGSSNSVLYIGMQQLVRTIRGNNANNLIFASGLAGGQDIALLSQYPLTGSNIVYGIHPYLNATSHATPAQWDNLFGNAVTNGNFPVVATEWSEFQSATDPECFSGADQIVPPFLTYLQQHTIGVIGYSLFPGLLIRMWDFTNPTQFDILPYSCPQTAIPDLRSTAQGAGHLLMNYFQTYSKQIN